jgi:tRNA pseudouridine55 synthase
MNAPHARSARRPVHGVLLLDKPKGMSSNHALQKVKWLLQAEKAGHTGTLDPLASGLLPICFGAATKYSSLHLEAAKAYIANLRLGQTTRSGDAEGEILQERPVRCSEQDLANALKQFTGPISQVPPMHSALKRQGKPLYELAREGIEIERAAREVEIYSIKRLSTEVLSGSDPLVLEVACSKGTYIRTLGEDIGEALGCGAHLSDLRRTRTGDFELSQSITLEALTALSMEEREKLLLPIESLTEGMPQVALEPSEAGRFLSGLRRRVALADAPHIQVFGQTPHAFLGTAHIAGGELIPDRLLNPIEVEQSLLQHSK